MKYVCPCCGEELIDTDEICEICCWEDDGGAVLSACAF
ncbi:CPCC family cysteine-rich protein [Domibacillus aminovorans]